ncbi:MAG TPA: helix-turn-helix domain-containing protein, partial [Rubrobacter sp.]|nr:helix-turn-helix domain-containing protein [Rubrobacter sp.]
MEARSDAAEGYVYTATTIARKFGICDTARVVGAKETNLRRELAILTVLGGEEALEDGGLGVVRIAGLIGREKSQVSRTLKVLAERGFVDRDTET